jgi:hypothetical protein
MDTQLEKTNDLNGSRRDSNTAPEKLEVDAGEVEHAMPSKIVDAVRHLNNSRAFKSDDSDGQIAWNVKSRMAACALVIVYVGRTFSRSHTTLYTELTHPRHSAPALLHRRHTHLHSGGYWGRRKDRLAASCIFFVSCGHLPVCWLCGRCGRPPGNCT